MNGPGTEELKISISVHSHLKYADLFHIVLGQVAKEVGVPAERLDWVALSLREAVNNAVLHGNKNDLSKWIQVDMEACFKKLVIRVLDEGKGFPEDILRDPRNPENIFRPNGRGIFLIRQFVDQVDFVRDPSGRFGIVMTVDLDKETSKEDSR